MTVPGSFNTLHINLTRKPFDNLKVRQAVMYAIDRHAVARCADADGRLHGRPAAVRSSRPASRPRSCRRSCTTTTIRKRRKALLAEAGFPDGLDFDSNCSQREDYSSTMLIVQEQLRAVGLRHEPEDRRSHRLSCRQPQRQEHAGDALVELSADPDAALLPAAVVEVRGQVRRQGRRQLQPLRRRHARASTTCSPRRWQATDFNDYVAICKQIELQVLRDLPLIGLSTLSFTVARSARRRSRLSGQERLRALALPPRHQDRLSA